MLLEHKNTTVLLAGKIRIILVNFRYPSYDQGPYLPVGLGILSEQLDRNQIEYLFFDFYFGDIDELSGKIDSAAPEYIAFSMTSLDLKHNYELVKEIKKRFPSLVTLVGGPHASFVKGEIMEECPAIDFAFTFEGEESLIEFLHSDGKYDGVKGLLYRTPENVVHYTGDREYSDDLDHWGFPQYKGFEIQRYGECIPIASSRGCPFSCTFCGAHLSMGKKWRARTVEGIIEEITHWYNRGYTRFNFVDSNFFLDKKRVLALCDRLEERNLKIAMSFSGMRAADADRELLLRLKFFGLSGVAIGIESANDDILKNIKKGETLEEIEKALQIFGSLQTDVVAFFIIGLPGETLKHAIRSLLFPLRYPCISVAYYFNLNPLPRTEIYQTLLDNQCISGSTQRNDIYDNIGGMGREILVSSPEYPRWQRMLVYQISKIVSRMVSLRNKRWKLFLQKQRKALEDRRNRLSLFDTVIFAFKCPKASKIETHLTMPEKKMLLMLAREVSKKQDDRATVVEIGSFLGASSCFLAAGCSCGRLYCIDTWQNDAMSEGARDTYGEFLYNTELYRDIIVPIREKSENAKIILAQQIKTIDLLFIDADHSYEGCKRDWDLYSPFLHSGSLVIFHDYGWAEGVKRVVNENVRPRCSQEDSLPNMWWGWIR